MIDLALAGAAGIATVLSPCILPALPVVLATTAGRSRGEPLLIIAGFVGSFAMSGIALAALFGHSGEAQDAARTTAVVVLLLAGIACLWSTPFERVAAAVQGAMPPRTRRPADAGARPAAPLLVGASLGLAWTPCAGPVLASVLALAASSQAPGRAMALLGAYALGAGLPMLAIAYGSHRIAVRLNVLTSRRDLVRKAFGAIAVAVAVLQLFHYDVALIGWATRWLPSVSTGL